jgi:ketosteroid isomerase-like protein
MRSPLPPLAVVLSFIDRINRTDLLGLVQLMTADHSLRVLGEPPLVGRDANEKAWRGYMTSFPEYVIYPVQLIADGDLVSVLGMTTGSHLALPDEEEMMLRVIWVATVRGDKVAAWEIREDTREERELLDLG